MSKARLVITAVVFEGRSQAEVARAYGVSKGWVSKLVARYKSEGEAAFEPRSRRPHTSPRQTPAEVVELIIQIRTDPDREGEDNGPATIAWHLAQHHQINVSPATISRHLMKAGLVAPEPKKRPKASYHHFEAAMPNECWQSDFTHYRLTDGTDTEILTWLDDCTRYAISVTAHHRVTTPIVLATFHRACEIAGTPASTLTDNGMVFTTRFAGGRGGRNAFESELRRLDIVQKNGRGAHPQTQGKVERFQQTMKKWLRRQPAQPSTTAELQNLIDRFLEHYNHRRGHSSLPLRATPGTRYETLPKATPTPGARTSDNHTRIRRDRIDKTGVVTLRIHGQLKHIGIGRTHARTHIVMLINDLHVRVVNATTGELLRELTIDPERDYQPLNKPETPGP